MKTFMKWILCIFSAALFMTGTQVEASAAAKPVKLNKTSVTLNIKKADGKTSYGTYKLKVSAAKNVKVKSVKYSSKDEKIAQVSKEGKITAKKAGTTQITAKVKYTKNKKTLTETLTCKVKVKNEKVITPGSKVNKIAVDKHVDLSVPGYKDTEFEWEVIEDAPDDPETYFSLSVQVDDQAGNAYVIGYNPGTATVQATHKKSGETYCFTFRVVGNE